MAWTAIEDQQLENLWTKSSLTADQIARELGDDKTKNAVISRAHRLNLPRRDDPEKARTPDRQQERQRVARENVERKRQTRPTLWQLLPDQCKWPMGRRDSEGRTLARNGTAGEAFFCGELKPADVNRPYCRYHSLVSVRGTQAAEWLERRQAAE